VMCAAEQVNGFAASLAECFNIPCVNASDMIAIPACASNSRKLAVFQSVCVGYSPVASDWVRLTLELLRNLTHIVTDVIACICAGSN